MSEAGVLFWPLNAPVPFPRSVYPTGDRRRETGADSEADTLSRPSNAPVSRLRSGVNYKG